MESPEREKLMQRHKELLAKVSILEMANERRPVDNVPKELQATLDECKANGLVEVRTGFPYLGLNCRGRDQGCLTLTDKGKDSLPKLDGECKDNEYKLKKSRGAADGHEDVQT